VEEIDKPVWILVVGVLGLLVNLIGLCLFRRECFEIVTLIGIEVIEDVF